MAIRNGLLALAKASAPAKRNDQVFGYQPPIETGKSIMDNWNPDTGQIEEPTLQGILGLLLGR